MRAVSVRDVEYSLYCELSVFFFFQAEDGIRDLVRSRGLGDVYKRQDLLRFYRDQQLPVAAVLTCADSTSLIAAVVVNDLLKEHCIAPISLTICDSY